MTKFERVQAAVAGEPVDRIPFSFWYHFENIPRIERAGEVLAKAELDFYRMYDPDILKVMHDVPYDLPGGKDKIANLTEWKQLTVLDPEKENLGRQMEAIRIILDEIGNEAPVIDTVFNSFAYAEKITGGRTMELYRENPADFHIGMSRIADSLSLWGEAIVQQGAAGIYLAIQGATEDVMSEDEYRRDFLPYDHKILERVYESGQCNVVHIHGEKIHWRIWGSLPFHALSWSSNITPPSIADARQKYRGCVMAGVNETTIKGYTPDQVKQEIREAIAATEGIGLIVASGCAVPTDTPPENLHAFKNSL